MNEKTLVLKFGGAALATPAHFANVADLIIQKRAQYDSIVVVVSAAEKMTDQLISFAHQIHPNPPQREYDMLISCGERMSMALLAMALCNKQCEAISFTGSQSGIITCDSHANAHVIDVRPQRLEECLLQGKIVIVAGFQGVSLKKEITTLGRGGSDTSAVALALALKACKVEFFKDVPGVFEHDPKTHSQTSPYNYLNYDDMLKIVQNGAKILHKRAIELAAKNGLFLHIRSFCPEHRECLGTEIFDKNKPRNVIPIYELVT